jgi:hypothetical protein
MRCVQRQQLGSLVQHVSTGCVLTSTSLQPLVTQGVLVHEAFPAGRSYTQRAQHSVQDSCQSARAHNRLGCNGA